MHGKSYTCIIYLYSVPRFCFHFFLLNISILINPHSMNSAPLFHNIELFIWKTSLLKQTLNTPTISTSRYGISKSNNSRFFFTYICSKNRFIYLFFTIGWSRITPLYSMAIPKIISFFLKQIGNIFAHLYIKKSLCLTFRGKFVSPKKFRKNRKNINDEFTVKCYVF